MPPLTKPMLRDSRADAKARKKKRQSERVDDTYRAWIKTQACAACGRYGVDPHHEPPRSHEDWHDHSTIPLCRGCHHSRHHSGKKRFYERIRACPLALPLYYRGKYLTDVRPADEF